MRFLAVLPLARNILSAIQPAARVTIERSWIPKRHLYQYYLRPWLKNAKLADTVMESYTEVDGVPLWL